jgi:hypothetical protein
MGAESRSSARRGVTNAVADCLLQLDVGFLQQTG